jgi:acyl-CoA synthetase (NDP forming)
MNVQLNSREAIRGMLGARSLAVVGASSNVTKFGGMTMETLIKGGYDGRLYPVNPKGGEILGRKVYESLEAIPDNIDAAVIIVPARFVASVIEQAADKGAKVVAILSAGFREFGRMDLEEEILAVAQKKGIRLMGPNIQGVTSLPNNMCAMFSPVLMQKGPVSLVTHSGSVTVAMAEWAERDKLGISSAVNLGNQTDICEADYIEYFSDDPNTGVIACYLEGIKDGKHFLSVLRRAAEKKPIVILKTGRTESGAKSAASHTGSLAGSHEVFNGICKQYGIVSVSETADLYDAAKGLALVHSKGNRVAIISSSGGSATLAVDEAEAYGLVFPSLSAGVKQELKSLDLPELAHVSNPFDVPFTTAGPFLKVAQVIDKYNIADTILFCFADPVAGADAEWAKSVLELRSAVAMCFMGGGDAELRSTPVLNEGGLAVFPSPERAVHGIAAAVWRASYLKSRGLS